MRNKELVLVTLSVLVTFGLIFGNGYIALAQYENTGSPTGQEGGYQGIGPPPGMPTGQDGGYQGIGPPPGMPSGAQEGYNNKMPQNGQNGGPKGGQNGGPGGGQKGGPQGGQMGGPSEEQIQGMQKKGQEKQFKGMKQGIMGMERPLKQFESTFASMEKKGLKISPELKEKLTTVRQNIDAIKKAQSVDEIQNIDPESIPEILQALGDSIQSYQKMQGLKKMLASMDRGVVSFEKQLVKLEKQGLTIPADVKEDLGKLKAGLDAIRNANSPEELDAADPDTLGDLMDKVNQSRPRLEMLAKWPRILKQADQQIARFKKELAKTKILVDRLKAKDIDVSANYTAFEEDVTKIKIARDEADALMQQGQSEEAFNKMEDEFFDVLDNVGEHQRVIQTMSNLSRFNVEFKRSMAEAQKQIKNLQRRKIDVVELQGIYDQALAKGNEIMALIKIKPIDEEAILSAMDTMENLKQQFQDQLDDLTGKPMPWEEKSPSQFQEMQMPKGFDSSMPQVKPQ